MSKEYEKTLQVISKPPGNRYDHEIHHLVPWFRSKAKLFKNLKADILADIIRNCDYVTKNRDDVIIKQGDVGECFYIVLSGKVTIYIFNKDQVEDEEDDGNFDNIIQYTKDGALDRVKLGYCVTSLESGSPFGDVALTSGDSIRTASIIADEHTDLLVVDRALYNRSVKEVLAKEFLEKTTFIKNNPLFSVWPAKYRKQLAMALYNESYGYESPLVRQGDGTTDMYFILSGQVEIQMDASQHLQQYSYIFKAAQENEVDKLINKAGKHHQRSPLSSTNGIQHHYSSTSIKRRGSMKSTRLCHLGVNESVGDVELTMDLSTYMQTAVCKETTVVLVLENKHYERLFIRRHPRTIEHMRDQIGIKLSSRISMLNIQQEIPFLNCLKKIIDSRNKPLMQTDKVKEEPTVFEAEQEFLNHKGPLIDQDGPGSVFYLIRLREKTKKRVRAKRGERIDKPLPISSHKFLNNSPKTVIMPVTTMIGPVSEPVMNTSSSRDQSRSPRDVHETVQPSSPRNVYETVQSSSPRDVGETVQSSSPRDVGETVQSSSPRDVGETVQSSSPRDVGETVQSSSPRDVGETVQSSSHGDVRETVQTKQINKENEKMMETDHSSDELDSAEGQSILTTSQQPLESPQKHDANLRTLEERLRQWLEVDNPKGKPQVAQLRRLTIQDMESQPRPGNRVILRRKNRRLPEAVVSSSSLSSSIGSDKESDRSKMTDESRLAAYRILLTH